MRLVQISVLKHWLAQYKNSYLYANMIMTITCANTVRPFSPTSFTTALLKQIRRKDLTFSQILEKESSSSPWTTVQSQQCIMMLTNPFSVLENHSAAASSVCSWSSSDGSAALFQIEREQQYKTMFYDFLYSDSSTKQCQVLLSPGTLILR